MVASAVPGGTPFPPSFDPALERQGALGVPGYSRSRLTALCRSALSAFIKSHEWRRN